MAKGLFPARRFELSQKLRDELADFLAFLSRYRAGTVVQVNWEVTEGGAVPIRRGTTAGSGHGTAR
jgi:hypothetical protein